MLNQDLNKFVCLSISSGHEQELNTYTFIQKETLLGFTGQIVV